MRRFIGALIVLSLAFVAGAYLGPWLNGNVSRITNHRVLRPSADTWKTVSAGEAPGASAPAEPAVVKPSAVHALGRLEPAGGLSAVGATPGARVEKMLVRMGQHVQAGQELAYIGGHAEAEANVRLIEAQLAETRRQREAETEFEQILDQEAKIERNELLVLEDPLRKTKQSNIKLLQDKTENSRTNYGRLVELSKDPRATIATQELERQFLVLRQDEEALKAAESDLRRFETERQSRLDKLDVALRKAKNASKRTRLALPDQSLERQLDLARERINQTVIRAPRAARVLDVLAKPGEVVGPRPILQLGDTSQMYAVAEVDEEQIGWIQKGQRARITNRTWSKAKEGTVESWTPMIAKNDILGLDPAAAAFARVVEVQIRIDPPCDDLQDRTHMQVEVDILLDAAAGDRGFVGLAPASGR
jgi:HlyD family secretion protein